MNTRLREGSSMKTRHEEESSMTTGLGEGPRMKIRLELGQFTKTRPKTRFESQEVFSDRIAVGFFPQQLR
jgi:hypothetical protein